MNLQSSDNIRIPYRGKWITKREYETIVDKTKLRVVDHSDPVKRARKKLIVNTCLDCGSKFEATGKYNRMCDICKRLYRNVAWSF